MVWSAVPCRRFIHAIDFIADVGVQCGNVCRSWSFLVLLVSLEEGACVCTLCDTVGRCGAHLFMMCMRVGDKKEGGHRWGGTGVTCAHVRDSIRVYPLERGHAS